MKRSGAVAWHPQLVMSAHTARLAIAMTLARVPIVAGICASLVSSNRLVGSVLLVVFIVADIADGEVARRRGGDSVLRRTLDSAVDRVGVAVCLLSLGFASPVYIILGVLMLSITLGGALSGHRLYSLFDVVVRAPDWHKLWSMSFWIAGITALGGLHSVALLIASASTLLCASCTALLARDHAQILQHLEV